MTSSSENGNISGVWHGSYTSDKIPDPVPVVMLFQQLTTQEFEASRYARGQAATPGETVVGVYKSDNGAIGTMTGIILGETVTLEATQATPTCPGSFTMQGELVGDHFEWHFQGKDCLGEENGDGSADRS